MVQLRALLLSSAVLTACAAAPVPKSSAAPPPTSAMSPEDAVLPWSHELQNAQLYQPPFLARFEKDGQGLYVVAAYHGCDPRTFRLIDEVFATHQVRLAVVEGWPASGGVNPPMFTGSFKEWLASGFCQGGGESGYTAFHAQEHGASFIAANPMSRPSCKPYSSKASP